MVSTALFSRKQPGGVFTIQDMEDHPNNVLFVNSAHAAAANALGGGQNPDKPFSTLAYVMTNAASLTPALAAGDVIYIHPDHAETISGAATIACATAGVRIIGLGWGSNRPTFTWSATGSTWTITAASVTISNIIVTATAAATLLFSSSAGYLTLDRVDYVEGSAIPLQFILTTAASDNLEISNCYHNAKTAGASAQLWIRLIGNDSPYIHDNRFSLVLENGATDATISGDASVRSFFFARNVIYQSGGSTQVSSILMTNGATGFSVDNRVICVAAGTIAGIHDVGNAGFAAETYVLDTADKSGLLDPVADA